METTNKTREENKTIARKFFSYFEAGDADKIEKELATPDYKLHFPGKATPLNAAESKKLMSDYKTAFPDWKFTIQDQVTEGDLVVTRTAGTGTHKGIFNGIAPTNKKVTTTGTSIHRIVNGKIAEEWTELDAMGLMQQIGAMPELAGVQHS